MLFKYLSILSTTYKHMHMKLSKREHNILNDVRNSIFM